MRPRLPVALLPFATLTLLLLPLATPLPADEATSPKPSPPTPASAPPGTPAAPLAPLAPAPADTTSAVASTSNARPPATPPAPDAAEPIVVLDTLTVTAPRDDAGTRELERQAREIRAEERTAEKLRTGTVSRALNGWSLPVFSIGFTADRLANGADRRAEILGQERIVLAALRDAKTKEERRALKEDLRSLRELRRAMVATDPRPFTP